MAARKKLKRSASVVDLSEVRARLRLASYQDKVARVLDSNQEAFSSLYQSGVLFSEAGARAGRDLLLAHLHLLKVVSLVNQLSDLGEVPAPREPLQVELVYQELDALLARTSTLTHRTGQKLTRYRGE